jgi:hypothetical protein
MPHVSSPTGYGATFLPKFNAGIIVAFKKGNKIAPGGAREGAGRHPDWFREQCRIALSDAKGVEFARDVLAGKEFPQLATGEGEVIPLPPALKDRLKALEWLTDRGYGKANQTMEVTGANGDPLHGVPTSAVIELVDALRQRNSATGGTKS